MEGKFRHELKYSIGYADYLSLRAKLRTVMQPDGHVDAEGKYLIRSVYFDNYRDKALREKIEGVAVREEFRIRYYNDNFSFIALEKKVKNNNLCLKLDAPVNKPQLQQLLGGDTGWMAGSGNPLVQEFCRKIQVQQLRPRVLVSYRREPYVYALGNVRVTFDMDIRTSLFRRELLDTGPSDIRAADGPGEMVLEVKFDEYLPDIIRILLQSAGVRQNAFSKYGVCRRFG